MPSAESASPAGPASAAPALPPKPRHDTLFRRLLVAQSLAALALLLLFTLLFYVDRQLTVAQLLADRWAPALRALDAGDASAPVIGPAGVALRSARELPPDAIRPRWMGPRLRLLVEALEQRGVAVGGAAYSRGERAPMVWLQLGAGSGMRWVGLGEGLVAPRWPLRLVLAIVAGLLIVLASSAWVTRRLTRPLGVLRARLESDASPDTLGPPPGATVEIAEIDAALRGLRERLALQERERHLLLAGVSHDLRSPLARIRMAAELLPDGAGVQPRREAIVRNTQVADRLIDSFLDHVRAGELPLDQTVDLAVLARSVVERMGCAAGELRCELLATPRLAQSHPLLLERLLQNLIDNALRHGRPPVLLRLDSDPDGAVLLDVIDQGPGLPSGREAEVLQAFARGDASRGAPGTGLGLAVVQRVVTRMHGTLSFEQRVEGHRVRVRWPGVKPGR